MGEKALNTKKPEAHRKSQVPQRQKTNDVQHTGSPADRILFLQRTIGNQAIGRLINSGALRAKLRIGQPGDIYEQEADRVAEQVMRMPELQVSKEPKVSNHTQNNPIQRRCPGCIKGAQTKKEEEEKILQTKEASGSTPEATTELESCISATRNGGQPLPESVRTFFERRLGHDFSQVRVHSDAAAEQSARDVNAHAYTVGQDIVFGTGRFAPGTHEGRRLIAHELTHVVQQSGSDGIRVGQSNGERGLSPIGSCAPFSGAVVQRKPNVPAKTTAAGGPKLDFRPARNPPPCACIVFMHHNEPNARLIAQVMYEFCHYNLAIVDPQTKEREINLPGKGKIDPNELFPRKVAEECWADDKPCEDFLSKNAGSRKAAVVEEYAQRQFFLAIKKCSDGFSLPVVALHNNTIGETAKYRKAVRDPKAPLDLTPVKGKTFDDALKSGEKSSEPNTSPFADLQEWLLKNVPGVRKKKTPRGTKGTLEGGPITPGKTNIFLWCSAEDISRCHIGDPERPDNVVWVTNRADFEKLRGTKTNVVLQTRVDPSGRSATDLSSLFVFLEEIVGAHFSALIIKLESDVAVDASAISDAIEELRKLQKYGDLTPGNALDQFVTIIQRIIDLLLNLLLVAAAHYARAVKLSQLRFINIETPQSPYDATTKPEDLRVQSYRDVKATLAAVGLDCCDTKPAEGETETAVEKIEKALREGKLPKT